MLDGIFFCQKRQLRDHRKVLYSMNSLQTFYAQIKTERQAQEITISNVIVKVGTVLPKSDALRLPMLESYRSRHVDRQGHKRRPMVALELG
jgi:hypothetical protein